ncbi:MAG TPA: glutamyl-tRNA reductase [Terriglobia bacterium]|nr:glutamyl-tRNA reductase [Terriglobia bacterium]
MKVCLIGLNHQTAPVEVREQVAIHPNRQPAALRAFRELDGVLDCVILSTCNRFEVICLLTEDASAEAVFAEFLKTWYSLEPRVVFPCLYFYTGREAIRHLYRVASSLDSLVVGEPQILGQVKDSIHVARQAGCLNTQLATLFEKALGTAKKVRTETEIASSAVSVSYAAVELARKIFGELKGKHVLILGAGKTSELTAKHLLNCEIQSVVVSNRTYEKAEELARRLHGKAAHFSELQPHLKEADIVISSTGAPHPILTKADVAEAIKERHNRPLFLIDIAVPRDIDPEVNKLSDVFLYDIDDLAEVVGSNLKMREKAAQQAEKIVHREVELTLGSVEARSRGTEIADLRKTLDKIGQEELRKAGSRIASLSEQDRKILELMVHRIVSKISHPLVMEMKQSPESSPSLGQRLLSFFQTVTS